MTFDEAWEIIPGNGWLSRPEGQLLWDVAQTCSGDVLEVGCYQGKSTCLLALAVGKLKLISLNLDHVVVSMRKITITSSTSMKGIKLMSGSAGALVLNFKMGL